MRKVLSLSVLALVILTVHMVMTLHARLLRYQLAGIPIPPKVIRHVTSQLINRQGFSLHRLRCLGENPIRSGTDTFDRIELTAETHGCHNSKNHFPTTNPARSALERYTVEFTD